MCYNATMKTIGLLFIAVIVLNALVLGWFLRDTMKASTTPQTTSESPAPIRTPTPPDPDKVLHYINELRRSKGIVELRKNGTLCEIAAIRVNTIITTENYSHDGFTELINGYYQRGFARFGENLSLNLEEGANTSLAAYLSWVGSPSHNELLEDGRFTEGCVVMRDNYTVLVVGKLK